MTIHLEHMARRLSADPFFLACALHHFARSEGLDEEKLAAALNCSRESLVQIQLCRAPVSEAVEFHDELTRIAVRFGADVDRLADAVRRGQAIHQMSRAAENSGRLMAARDGDSQGVNDDE